MNPSPRPDAPGGERVNKSRTVLAIDPGRWKCGVAVVRRANEGFQTLHQAVVDLEGISETLANLASEHAVDVIVIGNGTGSGRLVGIAEGLRAGPVEMVDETNTTMLARKRFFKENPPRGLRRLIPVSMQTPGRPHDDYVAVLLAEAYLSE